MDFGGLFSELSNTAKSRNLSKIKDSVGMPRSPNYGAGEGNRTLDVSLGSSSFAIKLHLRIRRMSANQFVPIQYTAEALFCQFVFSFATVNIAMPARMAAVPHISVTW